MMLQIIRSKFWIILLILVIFLSVTNGIESNNPKKAGSIVPGAYIVEFSSSLTRIKTNNHHELFYQKLADINTVVTPYLNFSSPLFTGASFRLNDHDDVSTIAALDSVATIWPVRLYSRPKPIVNGIINLSDNAEQTENGTVQGLYNPHIMTGVDQLHAQGYTGEDAVIAIIDSGVDYKHPALGGGFGLGHKIRFGYDYVGDDYTGYNLPVPDPDPLDCNGHGTHVTGIIGANDPLFTGVAPNATLGMYRVFGCSGSTPNDVLIAAFINASQHAHIITASLGSPSGWEDDPLAAVVSRIAQTGIICTVAMGNEGAKGLFYASGPADGKDVIAVGSVNNMNTPQIIYQGDFSVNSTPNSTFEYFPANDPFPGNISDYQLYALDFNTSNPADACTPLPNDTISLSEKIVLIRRGTCYFITKIANVQKFGARYVIFYNNENPIVNPQSLNGVFAGMVSAEQGAQWISNLQQNRTITFYFSDEPLANVTNVLNNVSGSKMSIFSSWSPTNELYIKPEVSAPGGNIFSTYPMNLGSYAILSGTSMATPYIAGVIALYKSAKGFNSTIAYQTLSQILSTTSTPVDFNNGAQTYPYLAPVIQQGGGLVNALAVISYTSRISPGTLALNDTIHFNKTVEFTISNTYSEPVSYNLTHQGAATAYALSVNTIYPQSFPPDLVTPNTTAIISPFILTIPANDTAIIKVKFSQPTIYDTQRIPIFSGYIVIRSSNNETFHLPYMGVACNMKDVHITDFSNGFPYISNSSDDSPMPQPIAANLTFNVTAGEQPTFRWRLIMSSALVRLDILGNGHQTEVAGVNILGSVPGFPQYWMVRNDLSDPLNHYYAAWNGTLSSGVQVPAGSYRFLYRALKILGDPNNNSGYENWTSPIFGIEYETHLNTSSMTTPNRGKTNTNFSIKQYLLLAIIAFILF